MCLEKENGSRFCAVCGKRLSFIKNRIKDGEHICNECLSHTSLFIKNNLEEKGVSEIKRDIWEMEAYSDFSPTVDFGKVAFDEERGLFKARQYPVFRIDEIKSFEILTAGKEVALKFVLKSSLEIVLKYVTAQTAQSAREKAKKELESIAEYLTAI